MRRPGHPTVAALVMCLTAAALCAPPANAAGPGQRDLRARVLTIRALADQGLNAVAAHAAERFMAENPDHDAVETVTLQLGGIYLEQGRLADAEHLFTRYRRLYSYADLDGESLFRLAEVSLRRQRWDEAEKRLRALRPGVWPASPFLPLADYYLALCVLKQNRPATAAWMFRRCAALYDGLEVASLSRLAAGIAEHRQGRHEAAVRAWEEASMDTGTRIRAGLLLATAALFDRHEFATGKRILDSLPDGRLDKHLRAQYLLCRGAETFFYGRRVPKSWLTLMESHPLSPQTAFVLGLLMEEGEAGTVELAPELSRLAAGIRSYRKTDHAGASRLLETAAQSAPPAVAPLAALYRARALASLGRLRDAADLCELVSDRYVTHVLAPVLLLTAAQMRLRTGQLAAAAADARSVIRRYPGFAGLDVAAFILAGSRAAQGRHAEAADMYSTLARACPQSNLRGPALVRAAAAFRRAGELARAQQAIGTVEAWGDAMMRTAEFLIEKARVTAEGGRAEEAVAILSRVLADPQAGSSAGSARRALIEVHERAGDLDDAIAAAASAEEKAVGLLQERELFLWRMRLLVAAGRPADGVRRIANLLRRDPEASLPIDVRLWQAGRLHQLGMYEAAAGTAEHVLCDSVQATASQKSRALFYRAEQLRWSGRLGEAEQGYRESLQAEASSDLRPAAATALAFCRLGGGDVPGARAAIENAGPAPNLELELASVTLLADAAMREKRPDEARALYAKILTRFTAPVHADWRLHARYGLAASLELKGSYREALVEYKTVTDAVPAATWAIADRENAVARSRLLEKALR